MNHSRNLAAILSAYFPGNRRLAGTDEQETPVAKIPAAYVVGVSVAVLFVVTGAAWLAWRFVSLELTAVYVEAFREARMSEE
jgi:hypothetical protein